MTTPARSPRCSRPRTSRVPAELILFSGLSCWLLLCGCERASGPGAPAREPFLAVVGAGRDDPLWPVLAGTAQREDELDEAGPPIRIVAPRVTSANEQEQMLRSLYAEGMRGLCVQVADVEASRRTLDWLSERGVAIVTLMRAAGSSESIQQCHWREEDCGRALADALHHALPDGGHVVILAAPDSNAESRLGRRLRAAAVQLKTYPQLQVLETILCDSPEAARRAMVETADRYPTLRGWLAMRDWPAGEGFLEDRGARALVGPTSGRVLVLCNPLPETWPALKSEAQIYAVCPDYGNLAPEAISIARAAMYGSGRSLKDGYIELLTFSPQELPLLVQAWRRWASGS